MLDQSFTNPMRLGRLNVCVVRRIVGDSPMGSGDKIKSTRTHPSVITDPFDLGCDQVALISGN
jgi:hypothetical protein